MVALFNVTLVKEVHNPNVPEPTDVTAGRLIVVKDVQPDKLLSTISFNAGNETLVKEVQPLKLSVPIVVTDGRLIIDNEVQL